jgi:hypothetical protein
MSDTKFSRAWTGWQLHCIVPVEAARVNYYESVVIDYLRADRAIFLNSEYCIQLNPADNPDKSGPHWYCDAVALDFRSQKIFLCEISYAAGLGGLIKRLRGWNSNWAGVRSAVERDCFLAKQWPITPWLFVPKVRIDLLKRHLVEISNGQPPKFDPKITPLEEVQPWLYSAWNRNGNCSTQATSEEVAE